MEDHGNKDGILNRPPSDIHNTVQNLIQLLKKHGWEKVTIDLKNIEVPQVSCIPMEELKFYEYTRKSNSKTQEY